MSDEVAVEAPARTRALGVVDDDLGRQGQVVEGRLVGVHLVAGRVRVDEEVADARPPGKGIFRQVSMSDSRQVAAPTAAG